MSRRGSLGVFGNIGLPRSIAGHVRCRCFPSEFGVGTIHEDPGPPGTGAGLRGQAFVRAKKSEQTEKTKATTKEADGGSMIRAQLGLSK